MTVHGYPNGGRVLLFNGKPDASSNVYDMPTQVLLGHVPLLLHRDPKDMLVIGLASGVMLGSAGRHPVARLECVDIVPGMVEAAAMFKEHNYNILEDPRVEIITADGRNHLALTDRQYDVIISEPSNPWIAGIGDLFTREFFELCRDRVRDGGVVCAWFQAYGIESETFRSVLPTFREVFPNMTLWNPSVGVDFLLLGCKGEWGTEYESLVRRLADPEVAADLERINVASPSDLLACYHFGDQGLGAFVAGARRHTDDNALEHSRHAVAARGHAIQARARMALGSVDRIAEQQLKRAAELNPSDDVLARILHMLRNQVTDRIRAGDSVQAEKDIRAVLKINPASAPSNRILKQFLVRSGRAAEADDLLEQAVRNHPQIADLRVELAELYRAQGRISAAIGAYRDALSIDGDSIPALNNLARILATCPSSKHRDEQEAMRLAQRAVEITESKRRRLLDTLAAALANAGRFDEAKAIIQKAIELAKNKGNAAAQAVLAERLNDYENARPFRDAILLPGFRPL